MKKQRGKIITFYSYKGGTGRSMAMSNIAWLLATAGKKVLAVDWDLEAPGLHYYFRPFLQPDPEFRESPGLIDFLFNYVIATTAPNETESDELWHKAFISTKNVVRPLKWSFPRYDDQEPGSLALLGAGRQNPEYANRVNGFEWTTFYEKMGGGVFLNDVAEEWRSEYDFILIDSRTGVSDTAGICTVQLPDELVVFFTMNNQSIEGAAGVAISALDQRSSDENDNFTVIPVASRVDLAELEKLKNRREFAETRFGPLLDQDLTIETRTRHWKELEIPAVPFYGYEEILAVFAEDRVRELSVLGPYMELLHRLCPEAHNIIAGPEGMGTPPTIEDSDRLDVVNGFASDTTREDTDPVLEYDLVIISDEKTSDEAVGLSQELAGRLSIYIHRVDLKSTSSQQKNLTRAFKSTRWVLAVLARDTQFGQDPITRLLKEVPKTPRILTLLSDGHWPENSPDKLREGPYIIGKRDENPERLAEQIVAEIDPYGGAVNRADSVNRRTVDKLKLQVDSLSAMGISVLSLRRMIGIIGITLSFIEIANNYLTGDISFLSSLSASTGFESKEVIITALAALAILLFTYRGYSFEDNLACNLGSVFALGIALIPIRSGATGIFHLISIVGFFLTMAYISAFIFSRAGPNITSRKRMRNRVYRICGLTILSSIILLCFFYIIDVEYNLVVWLESIAFLAFGVSWLVKGGILLMDS